MLPPSVMTREASTAHSQGALALMFIAQSQCFSSSSAAGRCTPDAALFTRISSRGYSFARLAKSSLIFKGVAEVRLDPQAANAELLDLALGSGGGLVAAEVVERDVGPVSSELERDGPAYSPRPTGYQRDLSFEPHPGGA